MAFVTRGVMAVLVPLAPPAHGAGTGDTLARPVFSRSSYPDIACSSDELELQFEGATITGGVPESRQRFPTFGPPADYEPSESDPIALWPFTTRMFLHPTGSDSGLALGNDDGVGHGSQKRVALFNPRNGTFEEDKLRVNYIKPFQVGLLDPIQETRRVSMALQRCGGLDADETLACIHEYGTPQLACIPRLEKGLFVATGEHVGAPFFEAVESLIVILDDPHVTIRFELAGEVQELRYIVARHAVTRHCEHVLPWNTANLLVRRGCDASPATRALPACDADWPRSWPARAFDEQAP